MSLKCVMKTEMFTLVACLIVCLDPQHSPPPDSCSLGGLIKCSFMVCKDFIPVHVTELKVMGNSTLIVHVVIRL